MQGISDSFYGFGLILGEFSHASGILANGQPHHIFSVARQTNHEGHIGKQTLNRPINLAGPSELPTSMPIYSKWFNSVNPQIWKALTYVAIVIDSSLISEEGYLLVFSILFLNRGQAPHHSPVLQLTILIKALPEHQPRLGFILSGLIAFGQHVHGRSR
jgi:hypothetical protein